MNINEMIYNEVERITSKEKLVTGMAITYGTPDITKEVVLGTTEEQQEKFVDEETIFDLASVTKLFLCLVIFKLNEQKSLSIDNLVGDYTKKYIYLQSVSLREIMNFSCSLNTPKRLVECADMEDALQVLCETIIKDKGVPEYNDINAIVLTDLIEGITGENFGNLVQEIIFDKVGVQKSFYDLKKLVKYDNRMIYDEELWYIAGSLIVRNTGNEPHDEKARLFNRENRLSGHAGLFSTLYDMRKISQAVLSERVISKESLYKISEGNPNQFRYGKAYGNMCYIKNQHIRDSEIFESMSNEAFAISGYTGTYWMMDPRKDIYLFIGSNRINKRITRIDVPYQRNSICINDKHYIISKDYVYEKDTLRNLCNKAMLEQE